MSVPVVGLPGAMRATVAATDMEGAVSDFLPIYARRPIANNMGGMRFNHSFATWFMLRALQPRFIIESGVWQGHSTWLIEQACPQARLFCLDLNFSNVVYRSKNAEYIQKDFAACAWSGIDRAATVCFFDDHQNAYSRLKDMHWAGISRGIFEDNYASGTGDCYSLRKVLAGTGHERLQLSENYLGDAREQQQRQGMERSLWSIEPRQQLLVRANTEDQRLFARNCREYFEFPPVALNATTDTGKPYAGDLATEKPIYAAGELPVGLRNLVAMEAAELGYVYIAYVELAANLK